jgi:hypothetical protein
MDLIVRQPNSVYPAFIHHWFKISGNVTFPYEQLPNAHVSIRPSAHVATQKKPIGHANYPPVSGELLPLNFNGSNSLVTGW